MAQDSFLHTTHRAVAWFVRANSIGALKVHPPYQRNVVWTDQQRAYLIDTILNDLPIPELYMQDVVDSKGNEEHIVIDGQQRITAILGFVSGDFALEGSEISRNWRDLSFDDLGEEQKKALFSYKFVVRVLPELDEEQIRKIFARLNRNTVALNDQELRNATYSGGFIRLAQKLADEDPFWSDFGVFSANDHRRMLDQEYISELMVAVLHGHQNKKDRLDQYYQQYEKEFEAGERLEQQFRKVTGEISAVIANPSGTRWRKKSDFYTLFTVLADLAAGFPLPSEKRQEFSEKLTTFSQRVDAISRIEEGEWSAADPLIVKYARAVSRAASDRGNRIDRYDALRDWLVSREHQPSLVGEPLAPAS